MYFEKGWAFYASSPFFRVKLTLFLLMGLASIYPTIRYIRWRVDTKAGRAPVISDSQHSMISGSLNLQLALLLAVMLSASLMAHGVLH